MRMETQQEYEKRMNTLLRKMNKILERQDLNDVMMVAAKIVSLALMQMDDHNRQHMQRVAVAFIDTCVNDVPMPDDLKEYIHKHAH